MRRERSSETHHATNNNNNNNNSTKSKSDEGEVADDRPNPYNGTSAERITRIHNFISSLKFSVPLKTLQENCHRTSCPKCSKQRRFFCYDCLVGCNPTCNPPKPPVLPVNVHVVLHPGEHRSKATTLPAATIAPDQVKIHTFPDVPDLNVAETVLLYPSATAVNISDMSAEELASVKNVVFIDSTWQQSKKIERDERIKSFRHVKIPAQETLFWRYQNFDPTYLATVEAIYYTLKEIVQAKNRQQKENSKADSGDDEKPLLLYNGEVDDLLLYFVFQYLSIQLSYTTKENDEEAQATTNDKPNQQEELKPANDANAGRETKDGDGDDEGGVTERRQQQQQRQQQRPPFTKRHFKGYILEGNDFEVFFK